MNFYTSIFDPIQHVVTRRFHFISFFVPRSCCFKHLRTLASLVLTQLLILYLDALYPRAYKEDFQLASIFSLEYLQDCDGNEVTLGTLK